VLERAETVRPVRPLDTAPDVETIAVADEVAMGAALMNARRLESSAVQLLVVDSESEPASIPGSTIRAQARWADGGWRQRLIPAPREAIAPAPAHLADASSQRRALAVLSIRLSEEGEAGLNAGLAALRAVVDELPDPALSAYWIGEAVVLAYDSLMDAGDAGLILSMAGYRIGGHYLAAAPFADPFSGADRLPSSATAAAAAAAASTPPGTACVTEDFAAALAVAGAVGPLSEYVGELDPPDDGPPTALYALKPRA
jgi:uncharacterized UPF0146 family protein